MSHFTVLVIGEDYEKQLAPYHEYESTGIDDEFVVDVDVTGDVQRYFNEPQRVVRLSSRVILSKYDASHTYGVPKDAEELEMSADEARVHGIGHATLDDAARDYYGHDVIVRDGRYFNRTNPNHKWDWYQLGGRWTGFFKLKPGAPGRLGVQSPMSKELARPRSADQVLKGDVDFEAMRAEAEDAARTLWNDTRQITGGETWVTWQDTLKKFPDRTPEDMNLARRAYHDQPSLVALKTSKDDRFSWEIRDELTLDLEEYVNLRRAEATAPHAFIKDGRWVESGEMGLFGIVHDAGDPLIWAQSVSDLLDSLPDDTLLSLVDCHT